MKAKLRKLFEYGVPKIVEVWWTDAYGQNRWHSRANTERERTAVKSVGYLVIDEPDFIAIARSAGGGVDSASRGPDDASEDEGTLHIPRGMVRRIRTLAPARSE